jgi:hypothetical protein
MLVEIPDNKVRAIMHGLNDLCHNYLEATDPPPGIGKTENEFKWFEDLNCITYDQVQRTVKESFESAINTAVDKCFVDLHRTFNVESGDVAPDLALKYDETKNNLVKICIQMLMHQM